LTQNVVMFNELLFEY